MMIKLHLVILLCFVLFFTVIYVFIHSQCNNNYLSICLLILNLTWLLISALSPYDETLSYAYAYCTCLLTLYIIIYRKWVLTMCGLHMTICTFNDNFNSYIYIHNMLLWVYSACHFVWSCCPYVWPDQTHDHCTLQFLSLISYIRSTVVTLDLFSW